MDLSYFKHQIITLIGIYIPNEIDTNDIIKMIDDTIERIALHISLNLVFIDLGTAVYGSLYTNIENSEMTLSKGLLAKGEIFKNLYQNLNTNELKIILTSLLKTLVTGWMHYLQILLMKSKAEEIKDLPEMIDEDVRQLKDFFCNEKDNEKGLSQECINELLKPTMNFIQYMKSNDEFLIKLYKKIGSQNEESKELIVRILFGRASKDVEDFFDLYKSILIK